MSDNANNAKKKPGLMRWLFGLSVIVVLCAPTAGSFVFGEEYRWWFLALDIAVLIAWGGVFLFAVSRAVRVSDEPQAQ